MGKQTEEKIIKKSLETPTPRQYRRLEAAAKGPRGEKSPPGLPARCTTAPDGPDLQIAALGLGSPPWLRARPLGCYVMINPATSGTRIITRTSVLVSVLTPVITSRVWMTNSNLRLNHTVKTKRPVNTEMRILTKRCLGRSVSTAQPMSYRRGNPPRLKPSAVADSRSHGRRSVRGPPALHGFCRRGADTNSVRLMPGEDKSQA